MERYIMTRKQYLQALENSVAQGIFRSAMEEYRNKSSCFSRRLRTCQASVYLTENYYLLKSYDTFIAAIDKRTGYCADVLRDVYGYTNTSGQHIAKFFSDYAYTHGKWRGDLKIFTYRNI